MEPTLPIYQQDLQAYYNSLNANVNVENTPENDKKRKREDNATSETPPPEAKKRFTPIEKPEGTVCLRRYGEERIYCPKAVAMSILAVRLENYLRKKIPIAEYVQKVSTAFYTHIAKNLMGDDILCEWLMHLIREDQYYLPLGTILLDHYEKMIMDSILTQGYGWCFKDFQKARSAYIQKNGQEFVRRFLEDLGNYCSKWNVKPMSNRVVILTDRNGGAHLSIAESIEGILKKNGYLPNIVQIGSIGDQVSVLSRLGLVFRDGSPVTPDETHQRFVVMQKQNALGTDITVWQNQLNFPWLRSKTNKLEALIQKVQELQPSLIINTLPYDPHVLLPHLLNIPMLIPQADFEFHKKCKKIHQCQEEIPYRYRKIAFGLPDELGENDETLNTDSASFHIVGYPTRSVFNSGASEVLLNELIEKYSIHSEDQLVAIMMGRLPVTEDLVSAVRDLDNSYVSTPNTLRIFVICGENVTAQAQINEIILSRTKHFKTFHILGLTTAKETAAILTLTANRNGVLFTKAGGSTVAEAVKLRLKLLVFSGYEWENKNRDYVVQKGLGKEIQKLDDGGWDSLSRNLQKALEMPRPTLKPVDCDVMMMKAIHRIVEGTLSHTTAMDVDTSST